MSDFVHLHCHTEFSLLDGMPKVEEYFIKASKLGMPGIAITEHGNLRSIYSMQIKSKGKFEFKGKEYEFEPIKPIFGIEFYVSALDYKIKGMPESEKNKIKRDLSDPAEVRRKLFQIEKEQGYRKRWHVLVFAKNKIGLSNLFKMHYKSWKDGFYYRPRIDFNLLKKHSEGLVITTACIGGYIPDQILSKDWGKTEDWLKEMKKIFGDDLYVEIQPHNIEEQKIVNLDILRISEEFKIKPIATNDCHYLNKDDYESHNVLLAIQSNRSLKSTDAWRFDDIEFYMKTKDEMYETFIRNHPDISIRDIEKSLTNTMEIFNKCNVELEIDRKKGILPSVEIPKEKTEKEYLIDLCKNGWAWRKIKDRAKIYSQHHDITYEEAISVYKQRLQFELKRIFKLKFENYFIIIYDLIDWARKQDILVGPGRGSSAASLVCFLIGITSIDPLEYDLLFDRFLNENRIDYPDVDMDFEDSRRKEIFKYLFEKYGEENVCQIGTTGRMKGKAALKDVGRVLDVPHWVTNQITKHIVTRSSGDARASQTVEDSFKEFDVCIQYNNEYPEVLKFVKKLEGKARQVGIHAAGIQISDRPIDEITPIEYRETKDDATGEKIRVKVSSFDWLECQGQGLVKLDVLGLKTLTVLKHTLKNIKKRHNIDIDLEQLSLDNKETLDGFTAGKFVGIFQFDSIGMTKTCEKLTFNNFNDIIALNALYRPGSMRSGLATHYINRSIGKEKIKKLHPIYDEITAETYGVLVYQEQLIRCFVDLAGYDPGTGDELRKKMAKSHGVETMGKEKDHFIDGAMKAGVKQKDAEKLFENMAFFGSYAFNKAHAAAYGVISYWGMYLKMHYPIEFFHSLMEVESEHNEIIRFVVDARKNKIKVNTPDINKSEYGFSIVDDKTIISGLVDIKGCGEKAVTEIINNQPFTSMEDFCEKVNRTKVHKGVIKALVKGGAFNSLYENQKALLTELDLKNKFEEIPVYEWMIGFNKTKGNKLYEIVNKRVGKFTEEESVTVLAEVCPIPPLKHKILFYEFADKMCRMTISKVDSVNYESDRVCVKGILVDIKYNNVGDFHKEEPSDAEKLKIGWGRRYANINIEDETGIIRCNIDINTFPTFRQIIDRGLGTPVMVYARLFKKSESLFCDIMVDLDYVKKKYMKNISLVDRFKSMTPFERFFLKHPVDMLPKDKRIRKQIGADKFNSAKAVGVFELQGLILRVKEHYTKKGKKMAFIDFSDKTGVINVVCWPEQLEKYGHKLKAGNIVTYYVEKRSKDKFIADKSISYKGTVWEMDGYIDGETSNVFD